MLKQYNSMGYTFYDLFDYGMDGGLNGLQKDELVDISIEVAKELDNTNFLRVIEELGVEYRARFKNKEIAGGIYERKPHR